MKDAVEGSGTREALSGAGLRDRLSMPARSAEDRAWRCNMNGIVMYHEWHRGIVRTCSRVGVDKQRMSCISVAGDERSLDHQCVERGSVPRENTACDSWAEQFCGNGRVHWIVIRPASAQVPKTKAFVGSVIDARGSTPTVAVAALLR
jgi:hypothetical protein